MASKYLDSYNNIDFIFSFNLLFFREYFLEENNF